MTASALSLGLLVVAASLPPQTPAPPAEPSSPYLQYELLRHRERVEADGSQLSTSEGRVLLRNAAAVAEFGQIGSPYVAGYGDVQFEDVVIEKPDGRRVEVKDGILEDVNPFGLTDLGITADVRFRKLTIPGLEAGDRLSYRIVLRERPLSPGRIYGQMRLTPVIGDPVQVYELDLPRDARIRVRLREGLGATWEELPAPANRIVRRLTLAVPQPAADELGFITALLQAWAEPDVMYTNFASWADVGKWWWELSRDRLVPDASVKRQALELVTPEAAPHEKIAALHGFVASKIRYLNVSFGLGRMQPRAASEVLASRYGDCKDKHTLLASLASSLGIDLRPVLINSVVPDLLDDVPGPQQFDHVVSVAPLGGEPADWLWLDSTNPFSMPGYLAPELRDKRALLIEASGKARIVRTPETPPFAPRTEVEVKGTLQPDGGLRGHVVWRFRTDQEVYFRSVWAVMPPDRQARLLEASLASDWRCATVTNPVASDPWSVAEPFRIEFDAERPAPSGRGRDSQNLWIPLPDFGLYEAFADTLELEAREFVARAEIEMPEGLAAHAPLSLALDRPFGRFQSAYSVEGTRLKLERTLRLSRHSLSGDDLAAYESFRKAVDTDRNQRFSILGSFTTSPGVTAESLHSEGLGAFKEGDYAKAIELFQKATELDAKVKGGLLDLGRALSAAGREKEALEAFSRQIEVEPFHESAYAWRAFTLNRLHRWDEAEKDLLKQIEVAPFEAWSYEELAGRRTWQRRLSEAADLYARAAAVEPKKAGRWVDLAWAQARDNRPQEARAALERALSLDVPDWMKISAGGAYHLIGDPGAAARLAEEGLASVAKPLAGLTRDSVGEGDLWRVEYVARAWHLIGAGALAAGDTGKAQRYLEAAWTLWFLPEAAWVLGDLREKQGRLEEAVKLWGMAFSVPTALWALPADRQSRIEAACRQASEAGAFPPDPADRMPGVTVVHAFSPCERAAARELMELRTVTLEGPALADLTEEVLLLVSARGRVEAIRSLSGKDSEALSRQLAKLGPAPRLGFSAPDDAAMKAVRKGILTCSRMVGHCALVLDLPGLPRLLGATGESAVSKDPGSIEIAKLDPPDGSTLQRGQRVKVIAVARYDLQGAESGHVALAVHDQAYQMLVLPPPVTVAEPGAGEATLTASFEVPQDATKVWLFLLLSTGRSATGSVATAGYTVE